MPATIFFITFFFTTFFFTTFYFLLVSVTLGLDYYFVFAFVNPLDSLLVSFDFSDVFDDFDD